MTRPTATHRMINLAAILVGLVVLIGTGPALMRGEGVAILPIIAVVAAVAAVAYGAFGLLSGVRHSRTH